jgi:hypothetical protein
MVCRLLSPQPARTCTRCRLASPTISSCTNSCSFGCTARHRSCFRTRTALYSTWNISLKHVKQQSEPATKLLQLWAYPDNQDVWYELLREYLNNCPEWFLRLTEDRLNFYKALRVLCNYALVEVDATPIEVSDIMPLPSYSENCGKGRAESLYDLAYQRPQPPQKGTRENKDRTRINQLYTHYVTSVVNIPYFARTLPRVRLPTLHSAVGARRPFGHRQNYLRSRQIHTLDQSARI